MLISGRSLVFYTAVVCYCSKKQEIFERLDRTKVQMLPFSEQEALAYLDKEPEALKCAGSVKTESLGMSLIDHIETKDPTALIGLPMLSLIKIFRQIGISLL
jgi:predicted house-cleaning NTP pyrophosphatase (Maf/HAM1 superfamily)